MSMVFQQAIETPVYKQKELILRDMIPQRKRSGAFFGATAGGTQERAAHVMELLKRHHFLERWMIETAVFKGYTSQHARTNKCRDLLQRMVKSKQIKRFRLDSRQQYIYYLQKSDKWPHWLLINTFHFNLLKQKRSWQQILDYELEFKVNADIRADGYYTVKTTLGQGKKFFLEADNGTHPFRKHNAYLKDYESKSWYQMKWAGEPPSYPLVVVVTTRPEEVAEKCNRELFRVCSVAQVKRDAWKVLSG